MVIVFFFQNIFSQAFPAHHPALPIWAVGAEATTMYKEKKKSRQACGLHKKRTDRNIGHGASLVADREHARRAAVPSLGETKKEREREKQH